MRRKSAPREAPLAYAAMGATLLAVPASAAALATSPSQADASSSLQARAKRGTIAYGRDAVVYGRAPSADAGQTVTLQFELAGTGAWRQVASSTIAGDGSFRLIAPLTRSGLLRATTSASSSSTAAVAASSSSTSSSSPERVAVGGAFRLRARTINDLGGTPVTVRGELLPRQAGRKVLLQGKGSGRWVTLSFARTSRWGVFSLRYRPRGTGEQQLRVRFAGDSRNASTLRAAGSLTVYRQTVASWYDDGGSTACGFHAYYGVANLSLPCGTAVSLMYHGRTVRAVVDDRGPYVSGRTWDLNQNTAAALGFGGVDAVWSSR